MSRLRMELQLAGIAVCGFGAAFMLRSQGWSELVVGSVLYGTLFFVAFLAGWFGVGAVGKLKLWQCIGVASATVLFAVLMRR